MENTFKITTYTFALLLSVALGFANGSSSQPFDILTALISLLTSFALPLIIMLPNWIENDEEKNENEDK